MPLPQRPSAGSLPSLNTDSTQHQLIPDVDSIFSEIRQYAKDWPKTSSPSEDLSGIVDNDHSKCQHRTKVLWANYGVQNLGTLNGSVPLHYSKDGGSRYILLSNILKDQPLVELKRVMLQLIDRSRLVPELDICDDTVFDTETGVRVYSVL